MFLYTANNKQIHLSRAILYIEEMLSNKDFSKFLATPSGGGGGGNKEKERFDLKTIKQWDNQIKTKMKNKFSNNDDDDDEDGDHTRSKGKPVSSASSGSSGNADASSLAYRDRALERRQEANPDYSVSYETAAKMDMDTSKYFGGDVEHTHLVKGLDHALLQKMKHSKQPPDSTSRPTTTSSSSLNEGTRMVSRDYTPTTELGVRLKQVLLSSKSKPLSITSTSTSKANGVAGRNSRAPLSLVPCAPAVRNAFEVELDVLSEQDVPTTVLRSAKVNKLVVLVYFFCLFCYSIFCMFIAPF